jgi:hypothetical protein
LQWVLSSGAPYYLRERLFLEILHRFNGIITYTFGQLRIEIRKHRLCLNVINHGTTSHLN